MKLSSAPSSESSCMECIVFDRFWVLAPWPDWKPQWLLTEKSCTAQSCSNHKGHKSSSSCSSRASCSRAGRVAEVVAVGDGPQWVQRGIMQSRQEVVEDQLPIGRGVAPCKALNGLDSFVWWLDSTLVRFALFSPSPFPFFTLLQYYTTCGQSAGIQASRSAPAIILAGIPFKLAKCLLSRATSHLLFLANGFVRNPLKMMWQFSLMKYGRWICNEVWSHSSDHRAFGCLFPFLCFKGD